MPAGISGATATGIDHLNGHRTSVASRNGARITFGTAADAGGRADDTSYTATVFGICADALAAVGWHAAGDAAAELSGGAVSAATPAGSRVVGGDAAWHPRVVQDVTVLGGAAVRVGSGRLLLESGREGGCGVFVDRRDFRVAVVDVRRGNDA